MYFYNKNYFLISWPDESPPTFLGRSYLSLFLSLDIEIEVQTSPSVVSEAVHISKNTCLKQSCLK
jgi:hypothetical protein